MRKMNKKLLMRFMVGKGRKNVENFAIHNSGDVENESQAKD